MMLFLSLVLSASTSFRGASRTLGIVLAYFELPFACPSSFVGRLWLLRLGYYKLTRAKPRAEIGYGLWTIRFSAVKRDVW